jgi:hypothetical protein
VLSDLTKWEFIFLDRSKEEMQTKEEKENNNNLNNMVIEVPNSWVNKIELPKERFESQYPNFHKTTLYNKCKLELFTEFHRKDGMVKKISVFSDTAQTQLIEQQEFFANRK